jgi:hypothetical protein
MIQYFAVIHDDDRWGPFESIHEPVALLNLSSRDRGHTEEEAHYFFRHGCALEHVDVRANGPTTP